MSDEREQTDNGFMVPLTPTKWRSRMEHRIGVECSCGYFAWAVFYDGDEPVATAVCTKCGRTGYMPLSRLPPIHAAALLREAVGEPEAWMCEIWKRYFWDVDLVTDNRGVVLEWERERHGVEGTQWRIRPLYARQPTDKE